MSPFYEQIDEFLTEDVYFQYLLHQQILCTKLAKEILLQQYKSQGGLGAFYPNKMKREGKKKGSILQ